MYYVCIGSAKMQLKGFFRLCSVAVASSICMEHWNSKRKITDVTGDA